jgi:pyridoxine 4-dehydrogenase
MTLGGDMPVRRMGFGAMRITGQGIWGEPPDREAAKRVVRRAVELGVTLIDTADSYGPEVSEKIIAEALVPYPAGVVVATKGGLTRSGPGQWHRNGKPAYLRKACERSLKNLRVERIDLYQLHAIDSKVPLEDSVGELAKLQKEGKIRHIGLSNVSVEQLRRAQALVPIVSVQNRYNLSDRASEDVLEVCGKEAIGFLPWYPLATGALTRAGGPLEAVAGRHGATIGQVALAWLLHHSPVMLPIPGTSSIAHLEENVAAAALQLTDLDLDTLAKA